MVSVPNLGSHDVLSQSCLCLACVMMLLVMWSEQWFMAGCLVTNERMWKETMWYNLSYHHGIGLEGLREIAKNLNEDSCCLVLDLSQKHPN